MSRMAHSLIVIYFQNNFFVTCFVRVLYYSVIVKLGKTNEILLIVILALL